MEQEGQGPATICLFISSSRTNFAHRRAIRNTWLRLLRPPSEDCPERQVLSPEDRERFTVRFLVSRTSKNTRGGGDADANADDADDANADEDARLDARLDAEEKQHGDIFFARTLEGYDQLWTKALEYLEAQLQTEKNSLFFVHADDDSYLRPDLLLRVLDAAPRRRFYWGYAWNLDGGEQGPEAGAGAGEGAGEGEGGSRRAGQEAATAMTAPLLLPPPNAGEEGEGARTAAVTTPAPAPPLRLQHRRTRPIRDPANKSHMPERDYPFPTYPPFCSGCGFALSRDLAEALAAGLPSGAVRRSYALLDPPFGVHLCGPPPPEGRGIVAPPVVPVHDARVRPYRALPLYAAGTVVQHYLRPEEMAPYHAQVMRGLAGTGGGGDGWRGGDGREEDERGSAAARLYEQLVGMGLLRR